MFSVIHAIKNIIRYRKRYLITAAVILLPMTMLFYTGFYLPQMCTYNRDCADTYLSRVEMRFRDDLQYQMKRGYDDTMTKFMDPAENFNADGSMDLYKVPVYADHAYFAPLEDLHSVAALELAYGTFVDGNFVMFPGMAQTTGRILLYGGPLSTWSYYENERIQYNTSPVELRLTEGREAVPGQMECVLYRDFAEWNDIVVGDRIYLNHTEGVQELELTVTGLAVCCTQTKDGWKETDISELDLTIGSMPYQRLHGMLYTCVFTDFYTAYAVHGLEEDPAFPENHTFNNYIPILHLKSPAHLNAFEKEIQALGYEDIFGFYPLSYAMEKYSEEADEAGAWVILTVMGGLGVVIVGGALLILFRERRTEADILYAMGIPRKRIWGCQAMEAGIFLILQAVLATGLSASVDRILAVFGRTFFIDTFHYAASAAGFGIAILYTVLLWIFAVSVYGICLSSWKPIGAREEIRQ